ncbi:hypothetical protein Hanom_Chr09g00783411 [Helianthus anomalus]
MFGYHNQNKYSVVRDNDDEQILTDVDLADELHPIDLIKLRKTHEEDKSHNRIVFTRNGIKVFTRIAISDFDLCINFDHVVKGKLFISPQIQ